MNRPFKLPSDGSTKWLSTELGQSDVDESASQFMGTKQKTKLQKS